MEVCSVGPHITEHDAEPIDEEDTAKIYDDVTGKNASWTLGRSSAPGGNQVLEHVSGVHESPWGERKGQGTRIGPVV